MSGLGGGIVTVPVLEYSLRFAVDAEYRMHVAVATSLAASFPTSISSFGAFLVVVASIMAYRAVD